MLYILCNKIRFKTKATVKKVTNTEGYLQFQIHVGHEVLACIFDVHGRQVP